MNQLWARFRRHPHPTILAIIGAAVAVFLVQVAFSLPLAANFGLIPLELNHAWVEMRHGRVTSETAETLAKLFTALFVHGGPEHLLFNMVFLWTFGSLTSQLLGKWWALGLFFVCGAAGNIAHSYFNPNSPIPVVGASGSICGYEGIYLGLALRWRLDWPDVWPLAQPIPPAQLAAFAVVGIVFDAYALMNHGQHIAYGAHVGGFVAGLVIAVTITQIFPTQEAYRRAGGKRRAS